MPLGASSGTLHVPPFPSAHVGMLVTIDATNSLFVDPSTSDLIYFWFTLIQIIRGPKLTHIPKTLYQVPIRLARQPQTNLWFPKPPFVHHNSLLVYPSHTPVYPPP